MSIRHITIAFLAIISPFPVESTARAADFAGEYLAAREAVERQREHDFQTAYSHVIPHSAPTSGTRTGSKVAANGMLSSQRPSNLWNEIFTDELGDCQEPARKLAAMPNVDLDYIATRLFENDGFAVAIFVELAKIPSAQARLIRLRRPTAASATSGTSPGSRMLWGSGLEAALLRLPPDIGRSLAEGVILRDSQGAEVDGHLLLGIRQAVELLGLFGDSSSATRLDIMSEAPMPAGITRKEVSWALDAIRTRLSRPEPDRADWARQTALFERALRAASACVCIMTHNGGAELAKIIRAGGKFDSAFLQCQLSTKGTEFDRYSDLARKAAGIQRDLSMIPGLLATAVGDERGAAAAAETIGSMLRPGEPKATRMICQAMAIVGDEPWANRLETRAHSMEFSSNERRSLLSAAYAIRARRRGFQKAVRPSAEGERRRLVDEADLFIPTGYKPRNGKVNIVLQLHGTPTIGEPALEAVGWDAVLVTLNRSGLSAAYAKPFSDAALFPRLLDEAVKGVETLRPGGKLAVGRVVVSSFSAGFGGVREILRTPASFDRIEAIVMADSLYCGYAGDPGEKRVDSDLMSGFERFAREAAAGRKTMLVSHSSQVPPGYASTTETADYLIKGVGASSKPDEGDWDDGWRQIRTASKGRFLVLGFSGEGPEDHMRHLRRIVELWKRLPDPFAEGR